MLRKLSAALLATALIAGPAFAAEPTANAASTQNAATAPAPANTAAKPAGKSVKLVKHARSRVVRHKTGKTKLVRNSKSTKTHRHRIAAHNPAKPGKTSKISKTSKTTKPGTSTHG